MNTAASSTKRCSCEAAAEDRHLGPAGLDIDKKIQRSPEALRIRVVAIEDQRKPSDPPDLTTHGTGFDPSDPVDGLGGRDVQQLGHRQGDEGVLDRVASRNT